MRKITVFVAAILTLSFVVMGANPTTQSAVPTTLPTPIGAAQAALEDWVGKFRGKSEQQILQELGNGGERTTWHSGKEKGLQLSYPFSPTTKLNLLFSEGWVVYAEFTVTSNG